LENFPYIIFQKKIELISIISRVISLALQFAIINQITVLIGLEGYGSYVFIFTVIGQLIHIDLGQSLFQQNRLSQVNSIEEAIKLGKFDGIILTTIIPILGVTIFLYILTIVLHKEIYSIFHLDIYQIFLLFISIFLFCISNLASRFLFSFGMGDIYYYTQTIFLMIFYLLLLFIDRQWYFNKIVYPAFYLAVLYYVLLSIVNFTVVYRFIFSKFDLKIFYFSKEKMIGWLFQSRGFWVYGIIGIIITQLDIFILGSLGDKNDLAYYALINKIFFGGVYTILFVYVTIMQPKITYLYSKLNYKKINYEMKLAMGLSIIFLMLFFMVFNLFISNFFTILFPKYENIEIIKSWVTIYYLFFIFRVVSDIFVTFFIATFNSLIINTTTIVQAVFSLGLQYYLFRKYAIIGLLCGLTITYITSTIVYCFFYF
jgi:O-antigen/teichoic acid export membrane protein